MPRLSPNSFLALAWSLAAIVSLIAVSAWGADYRWQITNLTAYQFFPVLGLLAFSLMWTHYVMARVRDGFAVSAQAVGSYFRYTGYAVLVLICLHPGLLIYQRFHDGFGLPPGSYESYVAPGMGWLTLLGTASLAVFLAFEFHRVFGDKPWWHYVRNASDFAMLAIFYHGLRLGSQQHGWFRIVWFIYGLSLSLILIRKYSLKISRKLNKPA